MSQFNRFIDNLVEMRLHYSKQIQQSDRSVNLAQDSLIHINALLVNELSSNQPFVENLTQMKSHYQSIIEENDRASGSARVQLNHINALLAEQLIIQQGDEQAIPLQASSVNDESAMAEKMGEAKPHPLFSRTRKVCQIAYLQQILSPKLNYQTLRINQLYAQ